MIAKGEDITRKNQIKTNNQPTKALGPAVDMFLNNIFFI
jgi:hypothetical protein